MLGLSLLGSALLIADHALAALLWDAVGEFSLLAFTLAAILLFTVATVVSLIWLAARWRGDRLASVVPLAICAGAAAFCASPVVAHQLDLIDFRANLAARSEVVERVRSGELWSGSPSHQLAFLPREYPTAVSNGAGQRALVVYREDDALHVVFYPLTGLLGERSAFLYSSSGEAPTLPNRVLPQATLGQSLGDGWYRIVFNP